LAIPNNYFVFSSIHAAFAGCKLICKTTPQLSAGCQPVLMPIVNSRIPGQGTGRMYLQSDIKSRSFLSSGISCDSLLGVCRIAVQVQYHVLEVLHGSVQDVFTAFAAEPW
jgi:hypothetical protein